MGELFPSRENSNFAKAHLKAYLKGHQMFYHGTNIKGEPIKYVVAEGTLDLITGKRSSKPFNKRGKA